ncbi:hypothetical protein ACIQ6K_37670 [Streptomyces sp. NPDC096354]|uniref:hypothetical protein n=1 Tax=Streptomyces sp. NPDC096354 TaxID=3366088 RepID=UPI0037F66131
MTDQQIAEHVKDLSVEDSGNVRTFVSDRWTLEYDLAAASWTLATLMQQAVRSAVASKTNWPTADKLATLDSEAQHEVQQWKDDGISLADAALAIYEPLRLDRASKTIAARLLQSTRVEDKDLPPYLVAAFDHLCTPAAD